MREMVVALACPVTLPLSGQDLMAPSLSPAPESDTASHSSVESVLEQEVRGRSFHNNGRIRFSSVALTNHRLVLVFCFYILC